MKRGFYILAISCLIIYTATGIFQALTIYKFGTAISQRTSFVPWYLLSCIIFIGTPLLLLRYYHYKKYWFAFYSLLLSLLVTLYFFIVVYQTIVAKTPPDTLAFLAMSVAGFIYSLSLVFSSARERKWLKLMGIISGVLTIVSAICHYIGAQEPGFHVVRNLSAWGEISSILLSILPLLYILNYADEIRSLPQPTTIPRFSKVAFGMLLLATSTIAVIFALNLINNDQEASIYQHTVQQYEADAAKPYDALMFVNKQNDTLPYRLLKPLAYDPNKKYPLVVCLSVSPGRDNVAQVQTAVLGELLSDSVNRLKYPAFVFVPQQPPGTSWGGVPGIRSVEDLAFESIAALLTEYLIDTNRLYVTGASMGGYGTWHFICSRPNMFAAAIPICGGGDPMYADKIKHVAVWAFHGETDPNVPVRYTQDMIRAMKANGGNPKYTEFRLEGHNIIPSVTSTEGLLEWLFSQRRVE